MDGYYFILAGGDELACAEECVSTRHAHGRVTSRVILINSSSVCVCKRHISRQQVLTRVLASKQAGICVYI